MTEYKKHPPRFETKLNEIIGYDLESQLALAIYYIEDIKQDIIRRHGEHWAGFYDRITDCILKAWDLVPEEKEVEIKLLELAKEWADKYTDGHYTLMKFTTNYRFTLGTINDHEDIEKMGVGETIGASMEDFMLKFMKHRNKFK